MRMVVPSRQSALKSSPASVHLDRIHAGDRLVEKQEFWIGRERASDLEPALIGERQFAGKHITLLR